MRARRSAGPVMLLFATFPLALALARAPQPPSGGTDARRTGASSGPPTMRRQSIVHHYPHPYPDYYHGDNTAGWRNPGRTGRYIEYYPPGNQFQVNPASDAVKVATFGGGGIPDRNEQLAAQQVGIQRYSAIQNHIDNMARPMFGVGYFGGFY